MEHEHENQLSILNEDGEVIDKETFLKNASDVYEEMVKDMPNETALTFYKNPEEFTLNTEETFENLNFYSRAYYLNKEITENEANEIFNHIRFWNHIDEEDMVPVDLRQPIKIYINTPGGDLDSVFSIMGTIEASRTPVHTITYGTGYSGGFFIGICGHKRYGYPYSSYLFHEGCMVDYGDTHKFLQSVDFRKSQYRKLKEIVIKKTKISEDDYNRHKKDDWYMDVNKAKELGVIDVIVDKIIY